MSDAELKPCSKYRKKPVAVEAMRFTHEEKNRVYRWASEIQQNIQPTEVNDAPALIIPTLEEDMICGIGDWLIKEPYAPEDRDSKLQYIAMSNAWSALNTLLKEKK